MYKKAKLILLSTLAISLIMVSCGDPAENMNKTMADFSEKCLEEEYDCDCYAKKVKEHFKTDDAYMKYYKNNDEVPDELISTLCKSCSKNKEDTIWCP
ncbi:hypothetical protein N9O13_01905 [Crocinitomicaceae bacterium]|nr:hypothetical protein [Crocinitomicaceae bacterium]MDA9161136.1 hypothetical protein [Crocinitomicaceae bacterium]